MGYLLGQFSAAELKARAQSGELQPDDEVSRDQERWVSASDIGGLTFQPAIANAVRFEPVEAAPSPPPPPPTESAATPAKLETCSDCSEMISSRAFSCPHCGAPLREPTNQSDPLFTKGQGMAIILLLLVGMGFPLVSWIRPMPKWEYAIESPSDSYLQDKLKDMGSDGWELVFARRATSEYRDPSYEMIFKRPK